MPISFPVPIRTLEVKASDKTRVYYPQLFGMHSPRIERELNRSIVKQVQELIDLQAGDSPSTVEEMLGTFEIKNNQRHVISLSVTNYTYHARAAHGMTYIKSLTFDTETGKKYSLGDLFKPNSNYVERLSELIQKQIDERNIDTLQPFTEIRPDQDFYIADKALVIYFQLYELTPYVFGFPMFPVSVYTIQDIIDEAGPLSRMAENN